jgi:hypothetical protein
MFLLIDIFLSQKHDFDAYYKNLMKRYNRGCFLSLDHKNIECKMNISPTIAELLRS